MSRFGFPIVFDATHSAQIPGNHDNTTGGNREYIPSQTFAAVSAGADGIFMEVHDDVDNALSALDKKSAINEKQISGRHIFVHCSACPSAAAACPCLP